MISLCLGKVPPHQISRWSLNGGLVTWCVHLLHTAAEATVAIATPGIALLQAAGVDSAVLWQHCCHCI